MKKIWARIGLIILLIVILFVSYTFVSINVFNRDYVNIFGYTYFEVGSGSMSPTIVSGDIVIVKINDNYDINDIVTYKDKKSYVTHRVKMINNNSIIVKGDANSIDDKRITKDMIIGKVVLILGKAGIWKKVMFDGRVLIPFIVTVILFVLAFVYDDSFKKYRMRKIRYKKEKKVRKRKVKK